MSLLQPVPQLLPGPHVALGPGPAGGGGGDGGGVAIEGDGGGKKTDALYHV